MIIHGDLNYLLKLLDQLNTNLYIRDVSYLGFPSFQIYIPEFSEICSKENMATYKNLINSYLDLYNLKNASHKNIQNIIMPSKNV